MAAPGCISWAVGANWERIRAWFNKKFIRVCSLDLLPFSRSFGFFFPSVFCLFVFFLSAHYWKKAQPRRKIAMSGHPVLI